LQSHTRATNINHPDRSATSQPGHQRKPGFQQGVEASLLRIDADASRLASIRPADGRNAESVAAFDSSSNPRMIAAEFPWKTERACSQPTIRPLNLGYSLEIFSWFYILFPKCGNGLFPDSAHLRVEP
jgi:hypothetical protein